MEWEGHPVRQCPISQGGKDYHTGIGHGSFETERVGGSYLPFPVAGSSPSRPDFHCGYIEGESERYDRPNPERKNFRTLDAHGRWRTGRQPDWKRIRDPGQGKSSSRREGIEGKGMEK